MEVQQPRIKGATFIHMDRRGGDSMWYREVVAVVAMERMVPHSHVVDKNWEEYLGNDQSQPQTRIT